VYSLVRSGDLRAVKIGGRGVWRVDRRRLEEYIERLHEETRNGHGTTPSTPLRAANEAAAAQVPTKTGMIPGRTIGGLK
jgi:Helix-turn-helix domain